MVLGHPSGKAATLREALSYPVRATKYGEPDLCRLDTFEQVELTPHPCRFEPIRFRTEKPKHRELPTRRASSNGEEYGRL
jgi:hypothetical protein